MKHSLRLARMARLDLTPNPDLETPAPPAARITPPPAAPEFVAPPAGPENAGHGNAGPENGDPVPDPSATWTAPPVTWEAVPPPVMEPPLHRPQPEMPRDDLPGSSGEHLLQLAYGSRTRAQRFYDDQMCHRLNPMMIEFLGRMEMAFIATADARGEADCSLRAGPPGFIQVLDERHVAYPEYRGNGVLASLGNISENPHIGIMLIDFVRDRIGLHINGRAMIVDDDAFRAEFEGIPEEPVRGRKPERWVLVEVDEAYIHCRKHIPRMQKAAADQAWGTDDVKRKGGDYFGVKADRKRAAEADRNGVSSTERQAGRAQSAVNGS